MKAALIFLSVGSSVVSVTSGWRGNACCRCCLGFKSECCHHSRALHEAGPTCLASGVNGVRTHAARWHRRSAVATAATMHALARVITAAPHMDALHKEGAASRNPLAVIRIAPRSNVASRTCTRMHPHEEAVATAFLGGRPCMYTQWEAVVTALN